MSDSDEEELYLHYLLVLLVLLVRRRRRRRKQQFNNKNKKIKQWVRDIFTRRDELGEYSNMVQEGDINHNYYNWRKNFQDN